MRSLNILLLACWLALPDIASGNMTKRLIPQSSVGEAMSEEILSWAGMVACKADYMRVREKCLLHSAVNTPQDIAVQHGIYVCVLAVTCAICIAALMAERRSRAVDRQNFAVREQELLARCQGIQAQAFDLGKKATHAAVELCQVRFELTRTRIERDDAQKQNQAFILAQRQQAFGKAERHREFDTASHLDPPPPLTGECSTPELEQLVVSAVNNDAVHSSVDQCYATPIKPVPSTKPNTPEDHEEQLAARSPATQDVELCDVSLAEEGRCYQVAESPATAQQMSAQITSEPRGIAATTATQTQGVPSIAAAPTMAVAPQPVQLQLQIVHPSGSSLLTREEFRAELNQRDIEQLEARKKLLIAENEQLERLKTERLNEMAEVHSKVLQPSPVPSAYVNTSRGTHTPTPFGSPLVPGVSSFSPFAFSPPISSGGGAMSEPTNSSAAASTFLRFANPPSSMSPPGSAGSNVLQSPLHQAVGASPHTGGSSAASAVLARSQQVQPLPMRPLESPGNSHRSTRMASPAHENLKATAEQAAKKIAQHAKEAAKQRQGLSKRPGSAGKTNQPAC